MWLVEIGAQAVLAEGVAPTPLPSSQAIGLLAVLTAGRGPAATLHPEEGIPSG
jgi:hypothetical protein